ncbi:MAG: hypothetical protein A3F94_00150 [Candidatus Spechtbacteria bacterium RIFCSPLOWO2_12_FULL_38_22]|uniref:DoxX family protein n=1 Tax=Candidatus Spechtbacteria bacterium RIFCSPLOWO2_12_FULL_38_22 TaxID=1802165 RepID=A0A1G2HGK9_9BACT|nr:MAG: hypothetical protein A2728_03325 [Candidatus Spechtbacteria bacterium RIFCSPHIGHO2_01_FULL_38_11]OGZ59213.1 MAG: hypothetical protein A3E58_00150 [Candidatus Spechtbacteria bacterium RIFCSPHIGHO2_12_FULL_38_30]OGZ59992.1 MAG: hypothetical protein A3A00_01330 [Candidatus Spechtbacteria bacterium RIFCSPLOWO2_01_FULL_38_20]OGZ61632.1 MAG: hypothetical protein A3F94_00150 [Candidatus Spechtbacteria bacterium RIFCSPLOWO2_12_FULL_38_22]
MDYPTLIFIGRLLFGGFFVLMGLNHFTKANALTAMAKSKKVPSPKLAVLLGGVFLLVGGFGVVFAAYVQFAVLLLVMFLIVTSLFMHNFWSLKDTNDRMSQMSNFLKNMALVGGALIALLLV